VDTFSLDETCTSFSLVHRTACLHLFTHLQLGGFRVKNVAHKYYIIHRAVHSDTHASMMRAKEPVTAAAYRLFDESSNYSETAVHIFHQLLYTTSGYQTAKLT